MRIHRATRRFLQLTERSSRFRICSKAAAKQHIYIDLVHVFGVSPFLDLVRYRLAFHHKYSKELKIIVQLANHEFETWNVYFSNFCPPNYFEMVLKTCNKPQFILQLLNILFVFAGDGGWGQGWS